MAKEMGSPVDAGERLSSQGWVAVPSDDPAG